MRRLTQIVSSMQSTALPLSLFSQAIGTRMQSSSPSHSSEEDIARLLNRKIFVVVGLSADESKPSYHVAEFLQHRGYKIIPVRPGAGTILGERIVNKLSDIPKHVLQDATVDVFRRIEDLDGVVADAVAAGATGIWFQQGLVSSSAIASACAAGMTVVADKCPKIILSEQR